MAVQAPEQPVTNLRGEKVALGPIHRGLLPLFVRWMNDFEVTRSLELPWRGWTLEREEQWYETTAKDSASAHFGVYALPDLQPIGSAGLIHVNPHDRTAEFGILIGEKAFWGRGYGTETTRLMLDYAFNALGLHNVLLRVYAYNERGLRAYQKAGFKEVGRRREAHRIAGRAYDVISMDALASDFKGSVLRPLMEG